MFIDVDARGGGGEPHYHTCTSCKLIIAPDHRMEEIAFEPHETDLLKLNGAYHYECAVPILSVKRAYDMMKRFSFG